MGPLFRIWRIFSLSIVAVFTILPLDAVYAQDHDVGIRPDKGSAEIAPPFGLSAPALARTASTLLLLWDRSPSVDVAGYEVYRDDIRIGSTHRLCFTATNLAANTTYHFSVRAVSAFGGLSRASNRAEAATKPAGPVFNVQEYGAKGGGTTRDTPAIQKAIIACSPGGTVLFPPGDYLVDYIELKSDITVELKSGATLHFLPQNEGNYPITTMRVPGPDGELVVTNRTLIAAYHVNNLTITGNGTIMAAGESWWRNTNTVRPTVLKLALATNVLVQGITIADSPFWNTHAFYADNVIFNDTKYVRISKAGSLNSDGLDPDSSRDVLIAGCYFSTQDDSIAIKSGKVFPGQPKRQRPCENIVIRDCLFVGTVTPGPQSLGFAVGSEICGGVRNVLMENCEFTNTASLANIKANRDRLNGSVENISIENCHYVNTSFKDEPWNRAPISVDLFYYNRKEDPDGQMPLTPATPVFRNIHFKNITVSNLVGRGIYLSGLAERPVQNLTFTNVTVWAKTGLFGRNLDGITLNHVSVNARQGAPFEWMNVKNRR